MSVTFAVNGLKETLEAFKEFQEQFGDKDAKSKVLIPAVREAMKPVLAMAKTLSPKDTGALDRSLYITARRPTRKDMKSRYITPNDSVISLVSSRPIPRKIKMKFHQEYGSLKGKDYRKAKRKFYGEQGIMADARAIANEFGTGKMSAKPFMRISLESQAQMVASKLGMILKQKMDSYKAKNLTTPTTQGK
jgi:HK97 gp10 family phage protein